MVPIALGTQTTGSTIRPASFCGVFGYRPTHGEHRLHGVMEASGSLDTLGILARSLDDIALYRDVLLGISPQQIADVATAPRIGFYRPPIWDQVEPTTRQLVEDAARRLAKAGADLHDVKLPEVFAGLNDAHRWISSFEFARTFTWEIDHHWNEISETLRNGRLADGLSCSFERYIEMQKLAESCRRQFDALWQDYDIMLTASAFGEAPVGSNTFAGAPLYMMSTALHVPSVSLPVLTGPSNMPIGLQILARRHDDRMLFAWARWAYRQLS
jgi:amidase